MNAPFKALSQSDPAEAPLWDLTDLYGSRDDARIAADLDRARALVDEMNGLQGRLAGQGGDPASLGAALDRAISLSEQASDVLGALGAFFVAQEVGKRMIAEDQVQMVTREESGSECLYIRVRDRGRWRLEIVRARLILTGQADIVARL